MFTVRAPNRAHNGISAGVSFTAGAGETDNPAALAYFRRAGYEVVLQSPPAAATIEIVPDAYEGLTKKQLAALAADRGVEVDPHATNAVLRDALIAAALADEEANSVPLPAPADAPAETDPFALGEGT